MEPTATPAPHVEPALQVAPPIEPRRERAATSPGPPSALARSPESELERALLEVANNPPSVDPRALWREAALELRGRRSSASEPPPSLRSPATPAAPPSPEHARAEAAADLAVPQAVAPLGSPSSFLAPPGPTGEPKRKRRRARPTPVPTSRAPTVVAALGAASLALLAWLALQRSSTGDAPTAAATTAAPAARPPPSSPPVADLAPSPNTEPSATSSGGAETPDAPPPGSLDNPAETGWLRVELPAEVDVYVQGVRVGASGRWLQVACGLKNARMARPGNPPPGHSFPMWLGEARTLRVPCGGDVRVRWSLD